MTADQWQALMDGAWKNQPAHDGPEQVRGVASQWVQYRTTDGSLVNVGPGMTPPEGANPTGNLQP